MTSKQEVYSICSVPRFHRYVPTAILVILGAAISVAVFWAAYSWDQRSTNREFASLADDRFHAIGNMIDDSARLLQFVDNAFLVGPQANSPGFPAYVRSLTEVVQADLSRHPAVQAVTWIPRVSRDQRAAYEQAARAVFDPTFQLKEPNATATTVSGQPPEETFVSYVSVARTPHHGQSGKDLARDSVEWKLMERARDTGLIMASAPMRLSSAPNGHLGYRLLQPLYHGDPRDIASRRQSIAGFLCVDLDISESVTRALKGIPPVGIDVWVSDDTGGEDVIVCRHTSRLNSPETVGKQQAIGDELESTSTTDFFGRKLLLRSRSTPAFWVGRTIWQPWVLLCGGLALTLIGAGYRLSVAFRAIAVDQNVATRMAALCQDTKQQQKTKQATTQPLSVVESTNDEPHGATIGAPVNTSDDMSPPTTYQEN
ncbi:MAG: CHASE domain-containing protein [Pirellulales bacterium]|nr:CHASE domain-containing protein [Pirellulales bacterium]